MKTSTLLFLLALAFSLGCSSAKSEANPRIEVQSNPYSISRSGSSSQGSAIEIDINNQVEISDAMEQHLDYYRSLQRELNREINRLESSRSANSNPSAGEEKLKRKKALVDELIKTMENTKNNLNKL